MNKMIKNTASGARWFAFGLSGFSVGLGLLALIAPRRVAHAIGVRNRPLLFRLLGLREIASGLGILTGKRTERWLWSRVGGDAIDLALMGAAFGQRGTRPTYLGLAAGGVAGMALLDTVGALSNTPASSVQVAKAITVNRPPHEVYQAWRDLGNLPQFMLNLQAVRQIDEKHSHWVTKSPVGRNVEWDAEITEDIPNQKIAWRSTGQADIQHSGSVQFKPAPGNRGTEVLVTLDYTPPAGKLGKKIATLFRTTPQKQIDVDLHRFEQWMETGSVITTEGQPAGRAQSTSKQYDVTAPSR